MRTIVLVVTLIGVGIASGVSNAEEPPTPHLQPAPATKGASASVGFEWLAGSWHLKRGDMECDEYWSAPRAGRGQG